MHVIKNARAEIAIPSVPGIIFVLLFLPSSKFGASARLEYSTPVSSFDTSLSAVTMEEHVLVIDFSSRSVVAATHKLRSTVSTSNKCGESKEMQFPFVLFW